MTTENRETACPTAPCCKGCESGGPCERESVRLASEQKGDWIPLHREMEIECCYCGHKHLWEFRVANEIPEWRATPLTDEKGENP